MHRYCLLALLVGCAAPPQQDEGLLDVIQKTPEQIAAENQQDIESARQALQWQEYVCSQPAAERTRLIEQTEKDQGWRIVCST